MNDQVSVYKIRGKLDGKLGTPWTRQRRPEHGRPELGRRKTVLTTARCREKDEHRRHKTDI